MDEIAALQTFVKPSDIVSISYVPAASPEGFAKGVAAASHTDILRVAATAGRALGLSSSDVVAVTAPLSGHAAFAAGCIAAEVTHAKLGEHRKKCPLSWPFGWEINVIPHSFICPVTVIPSKVFDAAAALEAMTLHRASIIVATRDQLVRLASTAASAPKGTYDLSSLRTGLVGEWNTAPVSFKYRFTTVSLPPRLLHQKTRMICHPIPPLQSIATVVHLHLMVLLCLARKL
jgi:hypothetical protein